MKPWGNDGRFPDNGRFRPVFTSETATLINHITTEGGITDDALARVLGVTTKKFGLLKTGAIGGTRAINTALAILAERVGYETSGTLAKSEALKVKPGTWVVYNDSLCQVLTVKKTGGPNAPYLSLVDDNGIYTGVSYRFVSRDDTEIPQSDDIEDESVPEEAVGEDNEETGENEEDNTESEQAPSEDAAEGPEENGVVDTDNMLVVTGRRRGARAVA